MSDLIAFLLRNPILLLLLIGPLLSGVGKAITMAAKKAEENRRRIEARDRAAQLPSVLNRQQAQQQARQQAPQPKPSKPKADPTLSPESAAARRIRELLEGRPNVDRLKEQARRASAAPVQGPAPLVSATPKVVVLKAPAPKQPSWNRPIGRVKSTVDPHVGEQLAKRKTPSSGNVGATALGELGGRERPRRRKQRRFRDLVQTENLPAMFVAQEVLGKPVSMREM